MIVNRVQNNDIYISNIKEMKNDADLALIRKVAAEWEKAASGKIQFFGQRKEKEKIQIAKDAKEVAGGIGMILGDTAAINKKQVSHPLYTTESIKRGEFVVYAAYDNRGKIQGVALVNLKGDQDHAAVLDELIVNPERVKSIGKRTPISGTGTKLVQTAAKKIQSRQGKKELGTYSLETAKTFYEKLGFKYDDTAFSASGTWGMCLGEEELNKLCTKV